MQLQGRTFSSGNYRYGFNGKENDYEVKGEGNQLDFGGRIYDSRLGRWLSVDPQFQRQPDQSTYKAFYNNPLRFNDPDGKTEYETIVQIDAKTGKETIVERVVSNQLFPKEKHVPSTVFGISTHSFTKKWDWYDKQTTITVIVEDGVEKSRTTSSDFVGDPVARTSMKSENWAKLWAGRLVGNGGTQPGGYHLVTSGGGADPTKWVALEGAEYVNVEAMLAALAPLTKVTTTTPERAATVGTIAKIKKSLEQGLKMDKEKRERQVEECEACGAFKKNGEKIDTSGKNIKKENIKKVPVKEFH